MENKFEKIIENLQESELLITGDQTFLNEIIFDLSIQCSILGGVTFVDVTFESIDFTGSNFINCKFQNCRLKDVVFRKCEFNNTSFENCQIQQCNITKANFHKGNFKNCIFRESSLRASSFCNIEFIKTKFQNSNLDLVGSNFIKIWNSKLNKWIEIKNSINLENVLKNMSFDD